MKNRHLKRWRFFCASNFTFFFYPYSQYVTMNLREWRHFLKLRTSKAAHPQMQEVSIMLYEILAKKPPAIFDDIEITQ